MSLATNGPSELVQLDASGFLTGATINNPIFAGAAAGTLNLTTVSTTVATQSLGDSSSYAASTAFVTLSLAGVTSPVVGSTRNLLGNGAGGVKTASWSCDEIVAKTALGGSAYLGSSLTTTALAFNGGGTGAGGMDTGSTPTSGSLYVYAIYNPSTTTWSVLGTTAGSGTSIYGGAHLPSGYTASCLIWAGVTDGSGNIQKFSQQDRYIFFPQANVLDITSGAPTSYTLLSLATVVPVNAKTIRGTIGDNDSADYTSMALAADSSGMAEVVYTVIPVGTAISGFFGGTGISGFPLTISQTLYYKSYSSSGRIRLDISGFTF